ncbi:hypothetical protein MKX03_033403 [Papaver bracteatum]|nr:hypothetical protein MKX03_033403 [Papaver bracteatum]
MARMSHTVSSGLLRRLRSLENKNNKLKDESSTNADKVVKLCGINNQLIGMGFSYYPAFLYVASFSPL